MIENKVQHGFYAKTRRQQNQLLLLMGLTFFVVILLLVFISWITRFYFIGILLIPITLSVIAPFIDTPALKKSGKLIYHSLLFLSEKEKNGIIKIHGGTLFDYVFVIDKKMNGNQRTNFILQQYLQGLLNLIEENENSNVNDLTIRGTSYIINDRTARRVGFKSVRTDNIQKLILIYNYFNVLITYSIAKGKLSFPKLGASKTFEANLSTLVEKKEYIGNLHNKLKNTLASHLSTKQRTDPIAPY